MLGTQLAYDMVDVFADGPCAGNQLAVVHGADALPDDALLAIAREFHFSETTFPVPLGPARCAVPIFTPGGAAVRVLVAGQVHLIARGEIRVPEP